MSFGFHFMSEDGEIVAGTDAPNLFVHSKGTLTIPSTSTSAVDNSHGDRQGVAIPNLPDNHLVFFKSSLPVAVYNRKVVAKRPMSVDAWGVRHWPSHTFQYIVFAPPQRRSSGYGLEVYSDSGDILYHTDTKQLNIHSFFNITQERLVNETNKSPRTPYPFTFSAGLGGGDFGVCLLNMRLYWTGYTYYDKNFNLRSWVNRYLRGVNVRNDGNIEVGALNTFSMNYSGETGNVNYTANPNSPNSVMVIKWSDYW